MGLKVSKGKVCRLLDIKPGTLQFFLNEALFTPDYLPERKSRGMKKMYSPKNMVEIGLIQELAAVGIRHRHTKVILDTARTSGLDKKWDPEGDFYIARKFAAFLLISKLDETTPDVKIFDYDRLVGYYKRELRPAAILIHLESVVVKVAELLKIGPDYENDEE